MINRLILALFLTARAASADVPARMETAFQGWMQDVGAQTGVLTLWQGAQQVHDVAIGVAAEAPQPLASLSKAVTGLCAATLVMDGRWTMQTTSAEVLGFGATSASVAELLTHSSGLGPDQTQGLGLLGLFRSEVAAQTLSQRALNRNEQAGTTGQYAYNNENFAILGAMIAAETGQSYDAYCRDAVLVPAGVTTAAPFAPLAGLLSFGGWEMSVQDYARVMHWGFGPDGIVGRDPGLWPQAQMGGGASYGVGIVQRAFRGSHNFWHFGLLCFPARANAGSYAVSWMQDWRAVAAFDGCVSWEQLFALDAALSGAVFP
ncbi:MAG: serine hydrolase domain-containing protein [Sulfitobacter sp.]